MVQLYMFCCKHICVFLIVQWLEKVAVGSCNILVSFLRGLVGGIVFGYLQKSCIGSSCQEMKDIVI